MSREFPRAAEEVDWLGPVCAEAYAVMAHLTPEEAIDATGAIFVKDHQVPWAIVFNTDDPSHVADKLISILRTPRGMHPESNPRLKPVIREMRGVLDHYDLLYSSAAAAIAQYNLVLTAANQPRGTFHVYQDFARKWPQYTGDWRAEFAQQFGIDVSDVSPELTDLLDKQELIAAVHYTPSIQRPGESPTDLIIRGFESLGIDSLTSLRASTRLMEKKFDGYRQASYLIRGIPLPGGSSEPAQS